MPKLKNSNTTFLMIFKQCSQWLKVTPKCLIWIFALKWDFSSIFKPLWYTWRTRQQSFQKRDFFLFSRLGNHHGLTGFPGLFLAALTAQSLSLVSTGYNKILTNLWNLLKVVRIHTMITLSPSKGNKKIIFSSPLSLTFALWPDYWIDPYYKYTGCPNKFGTDSKINKVGWSIAWKWKSNMEFWSKMDF